MKIIGITQARTGSTRFPKKILKKVNNKTLLEIHIQRIKKSQLLDGIIIATTNKRSDDKIEDIAKKMNVKCFRGSENDVLDRYYKASKGLKVDAIARLTADCPLIDPKLIDEVIKNFLNKKLDYYSNILEETYPDGQDIEIVNFLSLKKAWKEAKNPSEREHVTPYIKNNSTFMNKNMFTSGSHKCNKNYKDIRLTVDEEIDFKVIKDIIEKLGEDCDWETYANYYLNNKLYKLNSSIIRNEGYKISIKKDKIT